MRKSIIAVLLLLGNLGAVATASAQITIYSLNSEPFLDNNNKYPCTVSGFQSAVASLSAILGGVVDFSACYSFTIDSDLFSKLAISQPLKLRIAGLHASVTATSVPKRNTTIECLNRDTTWGTNQLSKDNSQGSVFLNNSPNLPTFLLANGPVTIEGCTFRGSGSGGHIAVDTSGVVLKNNNLSGKQYAFEFRDVGSRDYQVVVEGNILSSTCDNVHVTGTGTGPNFTFERNWFLDYGLTCSAINVPVGVALTGDINNNAVNTAPGFNGNMFNLGSSQAFSFTNNDVEPSSPTGGYVLECGNCRYWQAHGNNFGSGPFSVYSGLDLGSTNTAHIGPNQYDTKNDSGSWLVMNSDCVNVTIENAPVNGVVGRCSTGNSDITQEHTGVRTLTGQVISMPAGRLKLADQGQCTMTLGACAVPIDLSTTYTNAPQCFAQWTGTGTLTGTVKVTATTTQITSLSSSVTTDTAEMNWVCFGN